MNRVVNQAALCAAQKNKIKYGRDFQQAVQMFKEGVEWQKRRRKFNFLISNAAKCTCGKCNKFIKQKITAKPWKDFGFLLIMLIAGAVFVVSSLLNKDYPQDDGSDDWNGRDSQG